MARPSTYDQTKDYDKLASDYLAICGREQTKLPKISEFCREYVGADDDTVSAWLEGKQIPEGANTEQLSASIKRIKKAQREELIDDGLFGGKEVNVAMAIFLLKANHGMVETSRQELVGKDGQPLIPTQFVFKVDLAGGYLPPMGATFTTPSSRFTRSTQVQSPGMAQESKKNDDSTDGTDKTGAL